MTTSSTDTALLDAARRGDEGAFERLVQPFRGELHAHCYRMLASVQDAEDALQETLLRAWRALGRFEGRSSLRSWLYTIATNTCLTQIQRRPKRILPGDYRPAPHPHVRPGRLGPPPAPAGGAGRAARRVGLDRALPRQRARARRRPRRPRRALRAA